MGLDHSWDHHRRSQPRPGPLGSEHLDVPHSPHPRSLPSTRWSVSAQPGLPLLPLGVWEESQEERGGKEGGVGGGRGKLAGGGGAALGRQMQGQPGLAWAGARLEEAC